MSITEHETGKETILDTAHRNDLQRLLMEKELGEELADTNKQLKWIDENGELISDIIDHEEGGGIRNATLVGNYDLAIELLEQKREEFRKGKSAT